MPNRASRVENLLEQSLEIVVGFEIFEIAQKTKKLPITVGAQGCLEVLRGSIKGQPG